MKTTLSARLLPIAVLVFVSATCKSRRPQEGNLSSKEHSRAKGSESQLIADLCSGSQSYFRASPQANIVEFARSSSPEAQQPLQVPWYERARFDGSMWHVDEPVAAQDGLPECVQHSRMLTTYELAAALGCGVHGSICERQADFCSGSDCPVSEPPVSEPRRDEPQLTWGDAAQAEAKKAPELDCAWTGRGYLPRRLRDGQFIGDVNGSGALIRRACERLLRTHSDGVLCSWSGRGFVPYDIKQDPKPVGDSEQPSYLGICSEQVSRIIAGHMCALSNGAITVVALDTHRPVVDVGVFDSYRQCQNVLSYFDDPQMLAAYRESLSRRDVETKIAAISSNASGSNAAFALAEGTGGDDELWAWSPCSDPDRRDHLVKRRRNGSVICARHIDTVYSWGPYAKVAWLSKQPWTGQLMRDGKEQPIFTTQSSVSTFGYGELVMRFKLKPDYKTVFMEGVNAYEICQKLGDADKDSTVVYRYFDHGRMSGLDLILCSLGPVESWSYGTKELTVELQDELDWVSSKPSSMWESYLKFDGVDTLMPDGVDGHKFNPSLLARTIRLQSSFASDWIRYAPGVEERRDQHFSPRRRTYVNRGTHAASLAKLNWPDYQMANGVRMSSLLNKIYRAPNGIELELMANGEMWFYEPSVDFFFESWKVESKDYYKVIRWLPKQSSNQIIIKVRENEAQVTLQVLSNGQILGQGGAPMRVVPKSTKERPNPVEFRSEVERFR